MHSLYVILAAVLLISCGQEQSLEELYQIKKEAHALKARHLNENNAPQFINQLVKQDSLYLLQHSTNPVQWLPWSDQAFARAKAQNKPIFLSIGYSTCHWCHVMARESFENLEIAEYINTHFVPIKVDREELPGVDELYLTSVQMLSGKTGWPLTAVLTPDGQAFFGGTYFAPNELSNVLAKVSETWTERNAAVVEQANRISKALEKISQSSSGAATIDTDVIADAAAKVQNQLSGNIATNPAQQRPGFPREPEMLFLLDQARRNVSMSMLSTVSERLLKLASGGIHDHVGGGFHRYTVDPEWNIPHYEKMLYNQAQMGQAFFLAYDLNNDNTMKELGDKTLNFVLQEMQADEGGFYAALDAESEGPSGTKSEGEYYVWAYSELSALLNDAELSAAETLLGVSLNGNFNGNNVLKINYIKSNERTTESDHNKVLEAILSKLTAARKQRKGPQIDTKIITSWNAMTISALLTGYRSTKNQTYFEAAENASERLWGSSFDKALGLTRTIPDGQQRVGGSLEDYAYFANALIDMFDVSGDQIWLDRANKIVRQMSEKFHDPQTGGFYISRSHNATMAAVKLTTARDDAIYSGNSVAAKALARLYLRTGQHDLKTTANSVISAFSKQMLAKPETLSGMLLAANLLHNQEPSDRQYAAKGNIVISNRVTDQGNLILDIEIAKGWHINAANVLSDYLIPTSLTPYKKSNLNHCSSVGEPLYPEGQIVSLGFQNDKLKVYDGLISIKSSLTPATHKNCHVAAAELRIQACTEEVCLPPETIPIRSPMFKS